MKRNKGIAKYIIILILAAVLFIQSVNAISDTNQSNGDIQLLSLGKSIENVTIQEEGSLADGTLKLILSSSEPMYKIRMTPPKSPMLLDRAGTISVPPTTTLGQSGSLSTEFAAPMAGVYTFDLYDEKDRFIQTFSHEVRSGAAISLLLSGDSKFSLQKPLTVDLSYKPQIAGKAEVLTVILPPYFNVSTIPSGGTNYTVTPISAVPLPVDYYSDADSDILRTYGFKCNGFKIDIDSTVDSTLAFNFSYVFNGDYSSLGLVMAAYGKNPDRIPLRLVAFGNLKDTGELLDSQIIEGSSIITDADGNLIPESIPVVKTTGNYDINNNYLYDPPLWGRDNRELLSVASWHYPITDIKLYTPIPVGTTSGVTFPIVEIGDNKYIELKTTDITLVNKGDSKSISSPVSPKNQSSILTGQVFNFADAYVTYTYKGDTYTHQESVGYKPYVVPTPLEAKDIGFYFRYSNPDGNGTINRKQGQSGDVYNFAFGNHHQYKPSGTFNDAVLTFDFPFEVSPTAIQYNLGGNGEGPPDNTAPSLIKYYVHGESVPKTLTPPTPVVGQFPTLSFPGSPHVTKIELLYDKIPPASRFEYWITVNNGTKDESGAELPLSIDRQFTATITTADGNIAYGNELPDRVEVPFVYKKISDFKLIREVIIPPEPKEDSLYFGTMHNGNPHKEGILKKYQTSTPDHGENAQITIFRKTSKEMIDYKDIVITSKPKTDAEKAGFSLVAGMYLHNLIPGNQIGTAQISYLTNLSPNTWQIATRNYIAANRLYYSFSLLEGEYPLEVKTEIDVLYGSKMTPYLGSTVNDNAANGIIFNSNSDWNGIFLGYNGSHRKYFPGAVGEEYLIKENDRWVFDNSVSISSPAQHIIKDVNSASFVNDTSPSVIGTFKLYGTIALGRDDFATVNFDPRPTPLAYYQGQTFRFYMRNDGTDIASKLGSGRFNYELKYYLELYNDFELIEIENKNYTFLESRPIPENGTTLYIYEVSSSNNMASPWMKIRVRPDAVSRNTVPMIKAAGISHNSFVEDNMLPNTGDNAYNNNPPYHYINMAIERKFPTEWNSTDKLQYTYRAGVDINIFYNLLEKIDLNSKIGTAVRQGEGVLKSHNMSDFSVEAAIGGDALAVIPQYDALFTIPRKGAGGETPSVDDSGAVQQLSNDYDIYLKGPITTAFPEGKYTVTYYTDYDSGQTVDITSSSSEADLKSVTKILVSLEDLPPKATQIVNIPLYSTTKKTGAFTDAEHSYVGVSVKKNTGTSDPFVVQKALTFVYESYELSMRMGLDTDEDGRLRSLLGGIAEFQVFYNNGANDIMLPSPTVVNNIHTVKVNDDVSHIKINYLGDAQDKYLLTLQKGVNLNEEMDSDFPRDAATGGQLKVLASDLYSGAVNKYDAAFIIKPTLPIKEFILGNVLAVPKGESKSQLVDFKLSTTNGVIPAKSYYKQEISNVDDSAIANVSVNSSDKKIYAQGNNLGETTFTYTLTNRLGDKFVVNDLKVNVVRNFVTKAVMRKNFDISHSNLGTDKFSVSIWNEGTATVPSNPREVSGVNETADTPVLAFVERGMTHFISEKAIDGYENIGFSGTIDGETIDFSDVGNGIYSFYVPITAVDVSIRVNNKNASIDVTIRKELDAAAIAHSPNQKFVITLTEKDIPIPIATATLANGESQLIPGLVFGRTYVVEETPVTDFRLEKVALETGKISTGTQPAPISDNSYEFTLGVNNLGADIVVYNQLAAGKGLELYKHVTLDKGLPQEDYKFSLTLPGGGTYYGIVPATTTVFPALVKWYTDSSHTTEVDTNATQLKTGEYILTEDVGLNYELDEFKLMSGAVLPATTPKKVIFEVTVTSELVKLEAHNKPKEAGQVNITKKVDPQFLEDTMAFTIVHESSDRSFVSEAKVISDNFLFYSWKEGSTVIDANKLPFGQYNIKESLEGYHYALKEFHPATGVVVAPDKKSASFILSSTFDTADILAENMLFEKGEIKIKNVPDFDYGSLPVGSTVEAVKRLSDARIEVENTLRLPTIWKLTVISSSQTATISGSTVTLPYQVLKYSKDGTGYASLGSQQMIMDQTEAKGNNNIHQLDWTASDSTGIVADVWFHPATQAGNYSSTVTWSIEKTP